MDSPARHRFVRPRVRSADPANPGTWLLEDALAERLERGAKGVVWISGPAGAGKRSALAYVRDRFSGDGRVEIDPLAHVVGAPEVGSYNVFSLRVSACRKATRGVDALELLPWSRDEWIEYLLARHPAACASVMRRLAAPGQHLDLGGRPLLWAALLDELAADESLPDEFEALRAALARAFGTHKLLGKARAAALDSLQPREQGEDSVREMQELLPGADWLRQEPVLLLLAAEAIVLLLAKGKGKRLPTCAPDTELLRAVRPLLARDPRARDEATKALIRGPREVQPWAASLLHLDGPGAFAALWREGRLPRRRPPRLARAQLAGLAAAGIELPMLEAEGADFGDADLDAAALSKAVLQNARLERASLRAAILTEADLSGAQLVAADLAGSLLERAKLGGANLERAILREANLEAADLRGSLLAGARLEGANLRAALLQRALVQGASFEGADLGGAQLAGLDLRETRLVAAQFSAADLAGANLESQVLDAPGFSRANLQGALLTATRFQGGDFQHANLRGAGLAWVDWEGANLFGADLSGASFQLGSSRSGLVLNAPAGWGTRTGFYTDEYKEQGFKAPEEIRKANLRRADLRTARILETDFYLVDLRDALYLPEQEQHLRACGAILGN